MKVGIKRKLWLCRYTFIYIFFVAYSPAPPRTISCNCITFLNGQSGMFSREKDARSLAFGTAYKVSCRNSPEKCEPDTTQRQRIATYWCFKDCRILISRIEVREWPLCAFSIWVVCMCVDAFQLSFHGGSHDLLRWIPWSFSELQSLLLFYTVLGERHLYIGGERCLSSQSMTVFIWHWLIRKSEATESSFVDGVQSLVAANTSTPVHTVNIM